MIALAPLVLPTLRRWATTSSNARGCPPVRSWPRSRRCTASRASVSNWEQFAETAHRRARALRKGPHGMASTPVCPYWFCPYWYRRDLSLAVAAEYFSPGHPDISLPPRASGREASG
jgi:hypothetical protein